MIGIFDSGIAGLAAVRCLREALPSQDMIFCADTARSPYSNRSGEVVARYADEGIRYLIAHGAKRIVLCCSVCAAAFLQGWIGPYSVPVIEVISPAVALAVRISRKHFVGVIGSRGAMESGIYESLTKKKIPDAKVYTASSFLLDMLVEAGWSKRPETARIAKKLLHPLKVRQIDTLILDSAYLCAMEKKIAVKAGNKITIVKSWQAVADATIAALSEIPPSDGVVGRAGSLKIQVTDRTMELEEKCRYFLKYKAPVELVSIPSGGGNVDGGLRD